ncbi:butyrate kinase [Bacteroides heparinolyticus]|uniref:butyrate kinase n=2 Tax=Prevotella heparinolytica TaxID=28113 RepID=UPI0035A14E7B
MKVLVINPGSTSTKLAIYNDSQQIWKHGIYHQPEELKDFQNINEQYQYRRDCITKALQGVCDLKELDGIIGRGGLLKPMPGGVYRVTERIKEDLKNAKMQHASNLAGLLADELGSIAGCPAFIADPVVTDEMWEIARPTGMTEIERISIFHALNSRAVSRNYAKEIGKRYEDLNIIVAHLGGGITVSAHQHGRVVDVNDGLNGEGPFSPERAGTIPAAQLAELCFSGKYTLAEIKKKLIGQGGLMAHLGTTNTQLILEKAAAGDKKCQSIMDAMHYAIAKQIGAMHVTMKGKTDAIIITGGIAHNEATIVSLKDWVGYLAPIVVVPGEDELGALAMNAIGALKGELPLQEYNPK